MIFGIIACVVQVFTAFHVLVDFVCLNLQQKAVCVCVDELKLETILPLELTVVKIVHQYFVVVENRHPGINGLLLFHTFLVHVETSKILGKKCATGKQRTGNQFMNLFSFVAANDFDVNALLHFLHRFPEHGVVHEFVEVLLEFVCCLLPEFYVHPVVRPHLALLVKFQRPVHPLEYHPLPEIKLQSYVVLVLSSSVKTSFVSFWFNPNSPARFLW